MCHGHAWLRDGVGRANVSCPLDRSSKKAVLPKSLIISTVVATLQRSFSPNGKSPVSPSKCNLPLSAHKTIISPVFTTILGWIWFRCLIHASPHRTATLASCTPPKTVSMLFATTNCFLLVSSVPRPENIR